jgi:hypothetical protein
MAKNNIEFYVIPKDADIAKKIVRMLVLDDEVGDYFLISPSKETAFYEQSSKFYRENPGSKYFRDVIPEWAEYVGRLENLEILAYSIKN